MLGRPVDTGHKLAPGYVPLSSNEMSDLVASMAEVYRAAAAQTISKAKEDHRCGLRLRIHALSPKLRRQRTREVGSRKMRKLGPCHFSEVTSVCKQGSWLYQEQPRWVAATLSPGPDDNVLMIASWRRSEVMREIREEKAHLQQVIAVAHNRQSEVAGGWSWSTALISHSATMVCFDDS